MYIRPGIPKALPVAYELKGICVPLTMSQRNDAKIVTVGPTSTSCSTSYVVDDIAFTALITNTCVKS